MAAFVSTIFSLSAFAVTLTLSRGATATWENNAPGGFQHFVQPQTWLCAVWLVTVTVTAWSLHRQVSVPPEKFELPGLTPLSTAGWIDTGVAMVASWLLSCL